MQSIQIPGKNSKDGRPSLKHQGDKDRSFRDDQLMYSCYPKGDSYGEDSDQIRASDMAPAPAIVV